MRPKSKQVRCLQYILMALIAVVSLFPFYALVTVGTNPPDFSVLNGDVFAPTLYFENYKEAWDVSHLGSAMMNSLTITGGSLFILLFVSANAAYAISRFPNKLNRSVYTVFMLGMMIPPIVNTVPLYTVMQRIGGIKTRWAMILLMAANCMPLTTFLYVGFIRAIPRQFEEAAILDGCSWHGAFWRVIFPQLKPVTATAIIMNGVSIWNNYGQAIFFLQKRKVHTIPISISIFYQTYGAKWHLMAAAAIIGMIPALIVFLLFQKSFIKGLSSGGIKG